MSYNRAGYKSGYTVSAIISTMDGLMGDESHKVIISTASSYHIHAKLMDLRLEKWVLDANLVTGG